MSWLLRPQGVGPTEGNISFGGGLRPSYVTTNPVADATQQAIAAIAQILKQKQQDKIANQLLAVDNAPKAVAVDGTQPGSGTPDTALTDAMVKHNLNATAYGQTGFPTQDSGIVPDLGGVEGLQMSDLIRKRLQEQEHGSLGNELLRARIERLQHPVLRASAVSGSTGSFDGPHGNYTEYRDGYGYVTPRQAIDIDKMMARPKTTATPMTSEDRMAAKFKQEFGIPAEDIPNMTNLDLVDNRGNPVVDESTDPEATNVVQKKSDAYISADTPHGRLMAKRETIAPYLTMLKHYVPPQAAAPQSGAPDSKIARAQQAMSDPEATPQEKAKAQEILAAAGL